MRASPPKTKTRPKPAPALQRDALAEAGCAKVFEDTLSGTKAERPGRNAALAYLRTGDTFKVLKLDRLGR